MKTKPSSGYLKNSLLVAGIFFFTNILSAQIYDAEIWKGIEVEKGIGKNVTLSVKEQVRLDNNISRFKSTFVNLGLDFRLSNRYSIAGGYRFTIRENKYEQRYFADLVVKPQNIPPRLDIILRLRYQEDYTLEGELDAERAFRSKITFRYDKPRNKAKKKKDDIEFRPYISSEIFYDISNKESELNKFRLSTGFSYPLSKRNTVRLSYTYQQEFNVTNPKYSSIFAAAFTVELSPYKTNRMRYRQKLPRVNRSSSRYND